ncbi:MAG: GDSL-type esterase/lipase family protein [Bacillota bacterium]
MKTKRSCIAMTAAVCMLGLLLSGCVPGGTGPTPEGTPSAAPVTPTAAPTAAVTPSPNPTTPAGDSAVVPESSPVAFSYFDDAVFIGDSVSLKLKNYVTEKRQTDPGFFGKAQFLVAGSLGSGNALWKLDNPQSVHPMYNGEKMLLEDSVAACGANKVYIMLGLNDIAVYGIDGSVANMKTMIENIRKKSPGIKVFVQSATPMTRDGEKTKLNNKTLVEYDNALEELCKNNGYYYVDVASVMRDSAGYLPDSYSSDNYVHFTDAACEIWIDYLRTHTV